MVKKTKRVFTFQIGHDLKKLEYEFVHDVDVEMPTEQIAKKEALIKFGEEAVCVECRDFVTRED